TFLSQFFFRSTTLLLFPTRRSSDLPCLYYSSVPTSLQFSCLFQAIYHYDVQLLRYPSSINLTLDEVDKHFLRLSYSSMLRIFLLLLFLLQRINLPAYLLRVVRVHPYI